jgi:hypothetical protein
MLTQIEKMALQKLLDQIPVSRPGHSDLTVAEIEAVMMVHGQAVGFTFEQVSEFMLAGDI